jgi:uncharacterized protein (DUF488 family)
MRRLTTIGYEGAGLDAFIQTLRAANIRRLIDVRELPLSRKRGFSKRALGEALRQAGIEYEHLRALGDPKAGRDAARRGDMAAFRRIFHGHLTGPTASAALDIAAAWAVEGGSCLMCYERDASNCHRGLVAKAMADRHAFTVRHLAVPIGA